MIYNRFDPAKNYERHEFRADKVLQSAELNEIQSAAHHRLRSVADALFKDGDVVRDARIIVNAYTGQTQCESGAIYLAGTVRGVSPAELVVPTVGLVTVGVYLREESISELEDPELLNPAAGTRGYQEAGALRLRVTPEWGIAGAAGEFYPVWEVEDGYVRAKEPPPNLDAVTQALARYDRDSAGGSYIVSGLQVSKAADLASGEQVYTISEGRARVDGYPIEQAASRRLVFDTAPDLHEVDSEPHQSTTVGAQRVNLYRPPCKGVPEVRITARKTIPRVHGGFAGAADPLPDAAVIAIESVTQGTTTYAPNADYKLTAGQVDWSPGGAEPAPGSTYSVTYQYIDTVAPTAVDPQGFTVSGALAGTLIQVTYQQQLRRIDRLCLTKEGAYQWLKGTSSQWAPTAPVVPADMLAIATVIQTWDASRRVVADSVRVVPMAELVGLGVRIDQVSQDQAELRLALDVAGRDTGVKKGLFADPFTSDAMRDAGLAQSAAIVRGALQLPLVATAHHLGAAITDRVAPAFTYRVVLQQPARTGSMLVNPYQAFDPLPAAATLTPAVDRWTQVTTQWASPVTERMYAGTGSQTTYTGSSTSTRTLSETSTALEFLRPIPVRFDLKGFGPAEALSSVTFDGISVVPAPIGAGTLLATAAGEVAGIFNIPANVPVGTKEVVFVGSGGTRGTQYFAGQGTAILRTQQSVTTENYQLTTPAPPVSSGGAVFGPGSSSSWGTQNTSKCANPFYSIAGYVDPLAQTFVVDQAIQCAGMDLWFTAKSGEVAVQIRETVNGVPSGLILVERRLAAAQISTAGATRVTWTPVVLQAKREYAVVILCNDAITALSVAELGKWDAVAGRWVTSQPYQVGVLLSSSNAATWTPHQDRDLAFALLAARFTETERVIDLGTADLVNATDLMMLGFADRPSAASSLLFDVVLPGGDTIKLSDGQIVWLAAPLTGQVHCYARLRGDQDSAAVLSPGIQLIAATIGATGTYITRTLAAGNNSRVKVIYEGDLPGGSSVMVHAQGPAEGAPWVEVPYLEASTTLAGVREITHYLGDFDDASVRVRLTLAGGTTARPFLRNLRVVVL